MDPYRGYDPYSEDPYERQNAANWHAAAQNDFVRSQQLANPGPDPRQLAAQSLMQRYAPKQPSYANINGNFFINGEPFDDSITAPFTGQQLRGGEAVAQQAFGEAKRQAAADMLKRRSGDYAAGTGGRMLLQDPQFQRMAQQDQDAVYGNVYGNTLAEDMQADQLGGNMTMRALRFRNTLPARQKEDKDWLSTAEANLGANPFQVAGGYDRATGIAKIPGGWVKQKNDMGGEEFVQKPGMEIPVPDWYVDEISRRQARQAGYETPPQRSTMAAAAAQRVGGGGIVPMINGYANSAMQRMGAKMPQPDPVRNQKIQHAIQAGTSALQRNGINLPPERLQEAMRLATSFAGGAAYTDEMLVNAARMLADEQAAHAETLGTARSLYGDRQSLPPAYYEMAGP